MSCPNWISSEWWKRMAWSEYESEHPDDCDCEECDASLETQWEEPDPEA